MSDPSSRSAKRRKTSYGANRSTLPVDQATEVMSKTNPVKRTKTRIQAKDAVQDIIDNDHDSAHGSKDDSLVEGEYGDKDEGTTIEVFSGVDTSVKRRSFSNKKNSGSTDMRVLGSDQNQILSPKKVTKSPRTTKRKTHTEVEAQDESEEQDVETDANAQTRSSSRARRRPRRFSDNEPENVQVENATPSKSRALSKGSKNAKKSTPKGILTPSKNRTPGPRKSVAFDGDEKELEEKLGFKDISASIKKKKAKHDQAFQPEATEGLTDRRSVEEEIEICEPPLEQDLIVESILEDDEDVLVSQQLQSGLESVSIESVDDPELTAIKTQVLDRIVNFQEGPLTHLESQYETIHNLLSATINEGESNSILLLGARGSGKSLMLETALKNLQLENQDHFHTVRLNGFFQTDDKLALREIWRQLGREMHVSEEETGEVSSYADIMASLLTLLSHPDELDAQMSGIDEERRTAKSVVIIMDEFELFTGHPRQTLLYNLFDIAQSRKAPIAVIGCSTRMDVVDCLEKRVKSRYSHRWLFIPTSKSYSSFEETIRATLTIKNNAEDSQTHSNPELEWRRQWNDFIEITFMRNTFLQTLLKQVFYTNKSIADALMALYPVVATLDLYRINQGVTLKSTSSLDDTIKSFTFVSTEPSLLTLLSSLPPLHIALLTASARLETIHHLTSVNFNLVYTHYSELIQRSRLQASAGGSVAVGPSLRLWTRGTCRGAWEELWQWGFLVPVTNKEDGADLGGTGGGGAGGDEGGGSTRMFKVDITFEEVEWAVKERKSEGSGSAVGSSGGMGGMGEIIGKWCREI